MPARARALAHARFLGSCPLPLTFPLSETRWSPPAQSPRLRKGGRRRSWTGEDGPTRAACPITQTSALRFFRFMIAPDAKRSEAGLRPGRRRRKKKKLCHKDIKRCCDSPALSRRYGFHGSVSTRLARSLTSPSSADSDCRVSSDLAKSGGFFPLSSPKPGWVGGGECVFSHLSGG